jgi:hypothetical protein
MNSRWVIVLFRLLEEQFLKLDEPLLGAPEAVSEAEKTVPRQE